MTEQTEQQMTDGAQVPLNSSAPKLSFLKKLVRFFLAIIGIALVTFCLWAVLINGKTKSLDGSDTKTVNTGLPKQEVSIHLVNDEEIERYPLLNLTVAGLNVYLNTFEGLTVYRGATLEPGLAVSWTNPDSRTWIFKLRKGVKFQSGDTFTAKDVKYTIEQAKASENEKRPWFSQSMAARIATVKVIDDYTVELTTKEPDATLLNWLVYVAIVSKDQITRDGLQNAVGTGPYKINAIESRQATLEAYDAYWGGIPKVKKVVYKVIPDPAKAMQSLKDGGLDIVWQSKPVMLTQLPKEFYATIHNTSGVVYLTLDTTSAKAKHSNTPKNPFADIRVRKAMWLALNIPELIANTGMNAEPVSQFVTKDLVGYNTQLKSPKQNITEAKKLMTEAGFPDGFTVTLHEDNSSDHIRAVEEVKRQLATIGIKITPQILAGENYDNTVISGDFSMLLSYYYPDTQDSLDFIDTLFHTPNGSHGLFNVSGYTNTKLDTQIDTAASTFNIQKRSKITSQAHSLIMEELPAIPLYTENYQIIARNDVAYKFSLTILLLGFDLSGRGYN